MEYVLKSDLKNKLTVLPVEQSSTEKTIIITGSPYQAYFVWGQKGVCCSINPMAGNIEPQIGGAIPNTFEVYNEGTEAKSIAIKMPPYTSLFICSFNDFTIT